METFKTNVTQAELAAELGLTQSSIQRALAGSNQVSEKTRRRVQELARKYNYRPNVLAQGLYRRCTKTLGVVLSRFAPNHMEIFGGVEFEADRRGYSVLLAITNSDVPSEREKVRHLLDRAADALIVRSQDPTWEVYRHMARSGRPILFLECGVPLDYGLVVRKDEEHARRTMISYLLGLGHRRIGYITIANPETNQGVPRGYADAMADAGLPVDSELVCHAEACLQDFPGADRVVTQAKDSRRNNINDCHA